MGSSLKKRTSVGNKVGTVACLGGAVASIIWVPGIALCAICTIACLCGAGYFFKNIMKDYAGKGLRF